MVYMLHNRITAADIPRVANDGKIWECSHIMHRKTCINIDHIILETHESNLGRITYQIDRVCHCGNHNPPQCLISPLPVKPGGTLGFLAIRHSVCLSVCPSVCQSTRCPSTRFSELFSVVLWDIDLKFGMWICLDIIQIKFEFRHAWPTFTGVIALCWNLLFQVFLCRLLRYWHEIWYMNLSWHNTDQVRVSLRSTNFYRSYFPLLKFSFPDFSLMSFEILTWNLVYEFVLT